MTATKTSAPLTSRASLKQCSERLTAREAQILELVARGQSNRGVAETLFLSPRTVERHLANLYRKLRVHNRAEATRVALRAQHG